MYSDRYHNDSYTNGSIPFLFNNEITEYDMQEAGFSLIREYDLLPGMVIDHLSKMRKEQRKIEIGKLQRDNPNFTQALKNAFIDARLLFFSENDIEDNDLIAIKKDAIFTSKKCTHQKFGKYINFRPKNTYSSYIGVIDSIEIYFKNGTMDNNYVIDVKGINDTLLEKHKYFMLNIIGTFIDKMERSTPESAITYLKLTVDKYKRKELELAYYREFNFKSKFRTRSGEYFEEYWEDEIDDLDIGFNFRNVIIKLLQIAL